MNALLLRQPLDVAAQRADEIIRELPGAIALVESQGGHELLGSYLNDWDFPPGISDKGSVAAEDLLGSALHVVQWCGKRYPHIAFSIRRVVGFDPLFNARPWVLNDACEGWWLILAL